jgi:hypothetical protein
MNARSTESREKSIGIIKKYPVDQINRQRDSNKILPALFVPGQDMIRVC